MQQFQIRHYMGISAFLIEIGFNKLRLFYQQFQIRYYMGVSAFLIEIGFNKLGLFYRLDKSEEV